jgi:DNA modification methylase
MSNPWKRKEVIGDCTLYLGDCMEVMPTLGKVDAVITDPPYGTADSWQGGKGHGWSRQDTMKSKRNAWDSERPSQRAFDMILSVSGEQIIWGGNYFSDMLPPAMRWLAWDKCQRNFTLADFELAWTSQNKAARAFNLSRSQAAKDGKNNHATPKPISLMEWCLGFLPEAQTILDPFMGSGTTLVACAKLGRSGIGIELDEDYFNIACERIEKAYSQADLFIAPPENKDIKRNQVSMFDDGDAA